MIFTTYDQPDLLRELLGLIQDWNHCRMKVVFDADFDLNNKCSFYENFDFKLLKVWREIFYSMKKSDAQLAHLLGALFGYLIITICMQLLGRITELWGDLVIGRDPTRWNPIFA